jgi:hypothetical protein
MFKYACVKLREVISIVEPINMANIEVKMRSKEVKEKSLRENLK